MKKYKITNLILFIITLIIEFFIVYIFADSLFPILNSNDATAIASIILIPLEFILMGANLLLYLIILFVFIKKIKTSKILNEKVNALSYITFILPTLFNILNMIFILILYLR